MRNVWLLCLPLCGLLLLGGCQSLSYYGQAVQGHVGIITARQSVDDLIADPDTDETLRRRLQVAREARDFASSTLGLPKNDSYLTYVDTGRDYVTLNVIATPEFELTPRRWCFPVAGCVSYRGYFDGDAARKYGDKLTADGWDVAYSEAAAYSTLGWFDDPLLNTMLRRNDSALVGLIFHELAHQQLYVDGDSDFNEAFATFVEHEGVHQWLAAHDRAAETDDYRARLARREDFTELLRRTREKLAEIYASPVSIGAKRVGKRMAFAWLKRDYQRLRDEKWGGYAGYDAWFARELNNAHLGAIATYFRWVPAFVELYREQENELSQFYAAAAQIGALPDTQRRAEMEARLARAKAGLARMQVH